VNKKPKEFMMNKTTMQSSFFCIILCCSIILGFSGCEFTEWEDDHVLDPYLIGTWKASGPDYTDEYRITPATISHVTRYQDISMTSDADIVYVNNFNPNKTAGGLIIKKKENGKFTCVWFKELKPRISVLLGDAYKSDFSAAEFDDFYEALEQFSPAYAEDWGGGNKQIGTPQLWQY
jgi:hypothetical protein